MVCQPESSKWQWAHTKNKKINFRFIGDSQCVRCGMHFYSISRRRRHQHHIELNLWRESSVKCANPLIFTKRRWQFAFNFSGAFNFSARFNEAAIRQSTMKFVRREQWCARFMNRWCTRLIKADSVAFKFAISLWWAREGRRLVDQWAYACANAILANFFALSHLFRVCVFRLQMKTTLKNSIQNKRKHRPIFFVFINFSFSFSSIFSALNKRSMYCEENYRKPKAKEIYECKNWSQTTMT